MKVLHRLVLAVALALSVGTLAQARAPDEAARIEQALERGRLIYDYDQAAWHSTDVMLKALPRKRLNEIRGWVVEPDGDALSVLYYGYDGDTPYGVFRARFKDGKVGASGEIAATGPRGLTAIESRMALARKVAADSNPPGCVKKPFNSVVVPPVSETAPVEVYLLTPQMKTGEYPFGLHYLVTVGADGKVASTRPFTRSCFVMSGKSEVAAEKVAAMAITHLLDPTPTEIHVWLSDWVRAPIFVMTGEKDIWEVTPTAIVKVDMSGK